MPCRGKYLGLFNQWPAGKNLGEKRPTIFGCIIEKNIRSKKKYNSWVPFRKYALRGVEDPSSIIVLWASWAPPNTSRAPFEKKTITFKKLTNTEIIFKNYYSKWTFLPSHIPIQYKVFFNDSQNKNCFSITLLFFFVAAVRGEAAGILTKSQKVKKN